MFIVEKIISRFMVRKFPYWAIRFVPPFTDQVIAGGQKYGLDTGYRDVPQPFSNPWI
jgi:hypothetical protein